jgi:hypothetical protein
VLTTPLQVLKLKVLTPLKLNALTTPLQVLKLKALTTPIQVLKLKVLTTPLQVLKLKVLTMLLEYMVAYPDKVAQKRRHRLVVENNNHRDLWHLLVVRVSEAIKQVAITGAKSLVTGADFKYQARDL